MYFEPLISVKCCPKLHITQLRNNLHYICLCNRVGWDGAGVTDEKGGVQEKSGHAYALTVTNYKNNKIYRSYY